MMKKTILSLVVLALFMSAFSCGGAKTIPDDKLSDIFRDIYLVNSYTSQSGGIVYDSVDIYEPILNKYGYNTKDFLNTVSSFSKRKSTRLSDIIKSSVTKLENRLKGVEGQIKILEAIDSAAYEVSKQVVHTDSVIRIRSKADSSIMTFKMPVKEGRYKISYYYHQDSTDKATGVINRHYIRNKNRRVLDNDMKRIRSNSRDLYEKTLNSPAEATELEIQFGNYPDSIKKMNLTIDSLVIVRYLPREEALDRLLRHYIDYSITIDGKKLDEKFNFPPDSGTLHILPPLAYPEPDTLSVE